MNVFVEQLDLPIEEDWRCLLSPQQSSYLIHTPYTNPNQETKFFLWGVQIQEEGAEASEVKCGVLVGKLIKSFIDNESSFVLSIISIVFAAPKVAALLGPLLLQHVVEFASQEGWAGVHIGCPQLGQYGDFVRQLIASDDGSWIHKPGKVVVRLSNIKRVDHLLTRLEKAVERKTGSAQWEIEPYDPSDIELWKERIAFSKAQQLGVPWDPDDDSYDWEPSLLYSRVLKSKDEIIGWLICHFLSEDMLRYAKLWVDPGWEQSGAALAMLCDVMRSAHFQAKHSKGEVQAVGYPIPSGCFISHPTNHQLHRLVTSKFKPVCDSWTELENYYCYF